MLFGICLATTALLVWQGRPWIAEFAVWRGRVAIQMRSLDTALIWFERAEAVDSSQGEAQFWMARVERMRGRPNRMRDHLERALAAGFPAVRISREQVLAMAQSGNLRQVESEIPALLIDPGDDGPAICEAVVSGYLQSFRINEAMVIIEAWKRDHPGDPQPFVVRGMYYAQRRAWNKAAPELEAALEMAPDRVDARLLWAETLRNLHQLDAAREQFERCRQTSPRNPDALVGIGRCLVEAGDLPRAREQFERALGVDPDCWEARFWLGKLLASEGDATEAVLLLEATCRERPYEPDVRYALAMALQAAGRATDAQVHFQYVTNQQRAQSELRNKLELLERSPMRTDLRFEIGEILLEFGNPVEGVGWLRSVLELTPDHPEALAALAEYSRQRDKPPSRQ